jgi:glutamate racemase
MKIGVFDSGVGGLSVANAIKKAMPEHEVVLYEDKKNVPYGTRKPEDILKLIKPIFSEMVTEQCKIIVVACNTVSTNLISELRSLFNVPMIAVEPMVKPAAELTKSGVIAVCATPATLSSQRYKDLKTNFAGNIKVLEPDCADWPAMIEHNQIDDAKITERMNKILREKADVIVIGCTHYHWIEDNIIEIAGNRAIVLQPEPAIIVQLKRLLARLV